jgi:hypothetical protein
MARPTTLYQIVSQTAVLGYNVTPAVGAELLFAFTDMADCSDTKWGRKFGLTYHAGIAVIPAKAPPRRIDNFLIFATTSPYGTFYEPVLSFCSLRAVGTITFRPTRFCRSADGVPMIMATTIHRHVLAVAAARGPLVRLAGSSRVYRIDGEHLDNAGKE